MLTAANKTFDGNCVETRELPLGYVFARKPTGAIPLADELASFRGPEGKACEVPAFVNEFWTAKQRQASSLHEVSYRACFKPQLPRFFIERLTQPGEVIYDPFMG